MLQFVPNHRYAIHVWKIVPRNHAVVICSDIFSHVYGSCRFHMFMVHVERSGTVLPFFFAGVSTQSPLPSSCLEYGGLQCSHIFIIRCVFCHAVFTMWRFREIWVLPSHRTILAFKPMVLAGGRQTHTLV